MLRHDEARERRSGEAELTSALRAASAPNGAVGCVANVLRDVVLDGWPALQAPGDDGPIPLPLVHPRSVPRGCGYVDGALSGHVDYPQAARERLAAILAPVAPRSARVRFARDEWGWWVSRHPSVQGRNAGLLSRAVLLAVRADMDDGVLDRVCTDDGSWSESPADLSPARSQRARGRLVLHRLGCWPWALTDNGKLPHGWSGPAAVERFEQPGDEYVGELRAWCGSLLASQARDLKCAAGVLAVA